MWFILFIVIGAVVGGGTNLLAIRMLFRPHRAYVIGSWRIPFTPGLIPKRRLAIAEQLGKMVEEHLITPQGIAARLFEQSFIEEGKQRFYQMLQTFMQQEMTIHDLVHEHAEGRWSTDTVRPAFEAALKNKLVSLVEEKQQETFDSLLLEDWKEKAVESIPALSVKLLSKAEDYLHSPEGQLQMDQMIAGFFEQKGSFGGMIARMFQRVSPSAILTKELVQMIRDQNTGQLLTSWLQKEWQVLLEKTPEQLLSTTNLEEKLDQLVTAIADEIPVIGEWHQPLKHWAPRYEEVITESIFPAVVQVLGFMVEKHLSTAMKKIGIKTIVRDQVNDFPLQRLEEMLLSITGRELRMIAVLGALIGAAAGLIQALFLFVLL
ncbi:Uncharacterized membrane protein YheB, UPF0754 family [Evansella caseinilytica]|uniref:Uncharacterized membrane protein YheB, UPF0754 family n=1 Tax=Evansella caseinilytica TaxID=1503961 RepID=A0A1H3JZI4_9BACI|nr:Uncharacterized membrane protein YheB, UPF0754 family [Evansella caseinilytica]